ncbi:MAG: hypothetical protein CYG59_01760 [Chloroflexi bacterium]|nr:MAG: hypothetical protein CYG59_01760 [Chloroflexota bacterium]
MAQPVIAVVDDDQVMLETTGAVLSEEGYEVVSWAEGKTAYDFIRQHIPALAIVDLRMEHPQAGWITIHMLRLDPRTASIPVLVCTGDADFVRANVRVLRENGCDVLLKPFSVDVLLSKVTALLQPVSEHAAPPELAAPTAAVRARVAQLFHVVSQRGRKTFRRLAFRKHVD